MKEFREIIGTKLVNAFVKDGWEVMHVFAKPVEWSDDGNTVTEVKPAFVIVWNKDSGPVMPESAAPLAQPIPMQC